MMHTYTQTNTYAHAHFYNFYSSLKQIPLPFFKKKKQKTTTSKSQHQFLSTLPIAVRNVLSKCRNYPFTLRKRADPLRTLGRFKTCVGVMDVDTAVCTKLLSEAVGPDIPWETPLSVAGKFWCVVSVLFLFWFLFLLFFFSLLFLFSQHRIFGLVLLTAQEFAVNECVSFSNLGGVQFRFVILCFLTLGPFSNIVSLTPLMLFDLHFSAQHVPSFLCRRPLHFGK